MNGSGKMENVRVKEMKGRAARKDEKEVVKKELVKRYGRRR